METSRIEYGEIKPANGGLYGVEAHFDSATRTLKTVIGSAERVFSVMGGSFDTKKLLKEYDMIRPVITADLEKPVSGLRTTITKALGSEIGVM